MSKSKHWCFTLNNYTKEEEKKLNGLYEDKKHAISYIILGREVGDSNTPHIQGFVSFNSRTTLRQARTRISNRAHFEKAKGTPTQAADYCRKDGEFTEYGSIPVTRGHRSDIDKLVQSIKNGNSRDELRDEHPALFLRYTRAIGEWVSSLQPVREWITEVIVHYGKTGTGKTRSVFEFIQRDAIYVHPGEQWFDGYTGQSVVLFDDFNGSEFKLSYLLKLLDRYPMRVPIKGNYVNWIPKHIFITSNKSPEEWYPCAHEEHKNALLRRITLIKKF